MDKTESFQCLGHSNWTICNTLKAFTQLSRDRPFFHAAERVEVCSARQLLMVARHDNLPAGLRSVRPRPSLRYCRVVSCKSLLLSEKSLPLIFVFSAGDATLGVGPERREGSGLWQTEKCTPSTSTRIPDYAREL